MMNILFVHRGSITIIDGISTYILELSSALKKMGHQVYILCGKCGMADNMKSYVKENFLVDDIVEILDWGDKNIIHSLARKTTDVEKDM